MQFPLGQIEQVLNNVLKPVLEESNQRLKRLEDITCQIMGILERKNQEGPQHPLKQPTLKSSVSTAVLPKHQQQITQTFTTKKIEPIKEKQTTLTKEKDKEKQQENEKSLASSRSSAQFSSLNGKRNSVAQNPIVPQQKQDETPTAKQQKATNITKQDQTKGQSRPRTTTVNDQSNLQAQKNSTENKLQNKQVQKQPNQQDALKKDQKETSQPQLNQSQHKQQLKQPENQFQEAEKNKNEFIPNQKITTEQSELKETTIEQFTLQIEQNLDSDFNLLDDSPKRKSLSQLNSNKTLDDQSLLNKLKLIGKNNKQINQQLIEELIEPLSQINNIDQQAIEQELQRQIEKLNQELTSNDKVIEELMSISKGPDGQPLQSFKLKNWMEGWIKGTFELVNVDDLLRLDDPPSELKDILEVWLALTNNPIVRTDNDTKFWKNQQIVTQFNDLDQQEINTKTLVELEKYVLKYPHIIDNDIYENIDVLSGVLSYIFKCMCKHFGIIGDPQSSVSRIWFNLEKQKFKLQSKVNEIQIILQELKKEQSK